MYACIIITGILEYWFVDMRIALVIVLTSILQ